MFERRSGDTTLCDKKFVSDLAAGRWFSPGTPVSSTNKANRHDITGRLLKVAITQNSPNSLHIHLYL
jgi:hypothetical protein